MNVYFYIRGGSWYRGASYVLAANRDWSAPLYRRNDLGFRVVRSYE